MNVEEVRATVQGIPHMSYAKAKVMTQLILTNRFQSILELGFKHGVSTCYMAGALDELGEGHITTIDRVIAREFEPNVEQLLSSLGLTRFVTVYYEPTSYLWRMMKMLEEDPSPRFDLCYVDGAHTWVTDGFAFFLVDRLLKPGGLIVFDDLDWTYWSSPTVRDSELVRSLPQDEKTTPQIRKVFELLVKPHPSYGEFMERDGWAYARKISTQPNTGTPEIRREVVYQRVHVGMGAVIQRVSKGILRSLKR
jgi:predicted O-methyltransferase YrrM